MDLDGADVGTSSSSDGDNDDMDEDMAEAAPSAVPQATAAAEEPPSGPVIDADGFELVQKRRGRR